MIQKWNKTMDTIYIQNFKVNEFIHQIQVSGGIFLLFE